MEDLEELKKKVKDFKSKDALANKNSELKVINALRIISLVTKRLGQTETLKNNILTLKFLVNLVGKKKTFSINDIRIDLLNNVDIEEIAIKYCEPIEVILEIKKRNLMFENEVVSSKIYSSKELAVVFNKPKTDNITRLPLLKKISSNSDSEPVYWWTGGEIIKNYINILNLFDKIECVTVIDNKEYISLSKAASIIGIPDTLIRSRNRQKLKFFGVDLLIKKVKKEGSNLCRNYISHKSAIDAKRNKKYYIAYEEVFNYHLITKNHHEVLKERYLNKYSKEVDFLNNYIKKENLDNYINLAVELGYDKELLLKK